MDSLKGVYNILTTPFLANGALDEPSLRRLTSAVIGMGVTGITVLGVAGEAQKLTEEIMTLRTGDEIEEVVNRTMQQRFPLEFSEEA